MNPKPEQAEVQKEEVTVKAEVKEESEVKREPEVFAQPSSIETMFSQNT